MIMHRFHVQIINILSDIISTSSSHPNTQETISLNPELSIGDIMRSCETVISLDYILLQRIINVHPTRTMYRNQPIYLGEINALLINMMGWNLLSI